ncbi:MAG TPA: hypothetical protein VIL69_10420 [Roseomonas sp.]|jgi:hypothetical protein
MTARAPEGPKASFDAKDASEGYMPRPPSPRDLDKISEAQALITDEWTGEPRGKDRATGGDAPSGTKADQT